MPPRPPGWGNQGVRSIRWDEWPEDAPQAWLTNVGGTSDPDWHVVGAAKLAMPLVGVLRA